MSSSTETIASQKAIFDVAATEAALDVTLMTSQIAARADSGNSDSYIRAEQRLARLTDFSSRAATRKTKYDAIY